MKQFFRKALLLLTGYVVVLVVASFLFEGYVKNRIRDRMASSLDSKVTIGSCSLSLLRGKVVLKDVKVVHRIPGAMKIDLGEVEIDLKRFGWMVLDHDVETLAVRHSKVLVSGSSALLFRDRPHLGATKIRRGMSLRDVQLIFAPSVFLPRLGRIEVNIHKAQTRGVELVSGLSRIFALKSLHADSIFAGVNAGLNFSKETLRVSGGIWGAKGLSVSLPLNSYQKIKSEKDRAKKVGRILLKELGLAKAKSWLKDKVMDPVKNLFD